MTIRTALAAAVITIGAAAPSHAFFTECVVKTDVTPLNRPDGNSDPRWAPLEKGVKVAIRDSYRDWMFVTYFVDDAYRYGWLKRGTLTNCKPQEGTP